MTPVIEAQQLSSFYGIVLGLNNVSFSVPSGITGLVGPNGAGKSTLIKLITGQLHASSGELRVLGETPRDNPRLLARIGYCPEREQLPGELRPVEWLRGLASVSGLPWRSTRGKAERALQRTRLDQEHWGKRIGAFSKGMKQRVKLAQAIMLDPSLLILDEPMNGLDPMGRAEFGAVLKELNEEGTSILVSSHILQELEFLCSGFVLINWGRVLACGKQIDLRKTIGKSSDELSIRCSDPQQLATHFQEQGLLRGFLAKRDELTVWLKEPDTFLANWPALIRACPSCEIYELRNKNQELASLFERMTR